MSRDGPKQCLGIDFGTSTTHLCTAGPVWPTSTELVEVDRQGGLQTALLLVGEKRIIGDAAQEEWGHLPVDTRATAEFHANFKPDIAVSESAREASRVFLEELHARLRNTMPTLGQSTRTHVVVGVPAHCLPGHRDHLQRIVQDAGFGAAVFVEEPCGAALWHLHHDDITTEEVVEGVLTVDFGGGTCDVAFLNQLRVADPAHVWGTPWLGGRLFDDLFFQWFLEQNGGDAAREQLRRDGNLTLVRLQTCRAMKELFSRKWSETGSVDSFVHPVRIGLTDDYGALTGVSTAEFEQRARRFTPSEELQSELRKSPGYGDTFSNDIDLLAAFRDCVLWGFSEGRIRREDVHTVILTGGSARWPFAMEILHELDLPAVRRVSRSSNPETAVCRGLALYLASRERAATIKGRLQTHAPKLEADLVQIVTNELAALPGELADLLAKYTFDDVVAPCLTAWASTGGSIVELEATIKNQLPAQENLLREAVATRNDEWQRRLSRKLSAGVSSWLADMEHQTGATLGDSRWSLDANHLADRSGDADRFGELLLNDLVTAAVAAPASILGAAVLGGGGIALLLEGPFGLIVGAVLAAVAIGLSVRYGPNAAKEKAKTLDIPKMLTNNIPDFILKRALSGAREDMAKKVEARTREEIEKEVARARVAVNALTTKLVADLSVVEELEAVS